MKRILTVTVVLLATLCAAGARAEKADATKPTNVEANTMAYDDVKQVNTFTGNVVLVRGTMVLKADRMVVTQDAAGYQYATLYAAPGGLATFRQKRDGGPNLWMEGRAVDRIEYDSKTEVAKFYKDANLKLLDGSKPTDEVEGEFISYDSKAEFFSVNNVVNGAPKASGGRIKATIQPRVDNKAPQ